VFDSGHGGAQEEYAMSRQKERTYDKKVSVQSM